MSFFIDSLIVIASTFILVSMSESVATVKKSMYYSSIKIFIVVLTNYIFIFFQQDLRSSLRTHAATTILSQGDVNSLLMVVINIKICFVSLQS